MEKKRLVCKFDSDAQKVELEFLPDSGVQGVMHLDETQFTKLIQQLGKVRSELVKNKPIPDLVGNEILAVFNTKWYVQPEGMTDGSLLAFQHPSFGSLGFVMPRDQVQHLVSLLSQQLQTPPLSEGKKN